MPDPNPALTMTVAEAVGDAYTQLRLDPSLHSAVREVETVTITATRGGANTIRIEVKEA